MNKKDLILWLALIILTLSSYFFSESTIAKSALIPMLLGITAIKYFGVGFQFMELKKAHNFWKIGFISIFLIFSILVFVISSF